MPKQAGRAVPEASRVQKPPRKLWPANEATYQALALSSTRRAPERARTQAKAGLRWRGLASAVTPHAV